MGHEHLPTIPTFPEPTDEQQETLEEQVVFLRCDEFMQSSKRQTEPLTFYDEEDDVIEGVIHAWPIAPDSVTYFMEEERATAPERDYYPVIPQQGWHVSAINWHELDAYVTNIGRPFTGWNGIKPRFEEFDAARHAGRVVWKTKNDWYVRAPYQVIISPRKPATYE